MLSDTGGARIDTMTAGRWERVKVAFEEARTLDDAARQQYLRDLSSSDPEIAEELCGLLAAYDNSTYNPVAD